MDDLPPNSKSRPVFGRYVNYAMFASVCIGMSACAGHRPTNAPAAYRVYFSATRLKDHVALAAGSTNAALNQPVQVSTASTVATEETPALPKFTATLSATKTPGTFQLITRTSIREAVRTKKGKLKRTKRDQGSLLSLRLGETQSASPAGDPVQVEVRVERR